AHLHFISLGMALKWVDLRNLKSLSACREKIKASVASHRPGQWIIGRGWNHHKWDDTTEPSMKDLDDITPNNPAMMIRACGHSVWVNSEALRRAGITSTTPDPPGGKIERDPVSGKPTGLLREARKLIENHIPAPTLEERMEFALIAQKEALRYGITGVHSCETLQQWDALSDLDSEGKLKIRIHHLTPPEDLNEAASRGLLSNSESKRLWLGHVKLFADGSLGAGTALLHEPYTDAPTERGIACMSKEEMIEKIKQAYQHDRDVAIHAIGDLGVTNAIEAICTARNHSTTARRDRIEHVQLFRPQDLEKFRKLDVVASVQPVFLSTDWQPALKRWGAERCRYGYAWKSILKAGVRQQFGSDAPVEPINPLLGLQAAVTRKTPDGQPEDGWYPEEKLNLHQAIEGFTVIPAWTARKETLSGTIERGKWADLTVFDRDLFKTPAQAWHTVDIEMTIVDGEVVYQK
ncbi:MAG: amidohydrolase, partial [Deltaproteobacteria bacterium]|nr:amidohydrolase [Deltaproteobacteria bacterium]